MHLLYNEPNWTDGLVPGIPQVVLAVDRGDMLVEAAQINPQSFRVLRHCDDGMQIFAPDWAGAVELARRWWASFVDNTFRERYAPFTNAVKGYNETLANSQNEEEVRQRVLMEQALAFVWNNEYRSQNDYSHIRPVLASAAVGNWIPEEIALVSVRENALTSYHAYMYWQNKERPEWERDNLSGLWAVMDEEYEIAKPDWIFTEGSVFESAITGWRAKECLDGDVDLLVEAMRTQFREIKESKAWKEGRVIGPPVWFTTGGSSTWEKFYTNAYELKLLGAMLAEEWFAGEDEHPISPENQRLIWEDSIQKQKDGGLYLNPEAALQRAIYASNMVPVIGEQYDLFIDNVQYVYQAAESLQTGERKVFVWLNYEVVVIEDLGTR